MAYIGHVYRVLFGYLILTFLVVVDNLSCVGWINQPVTGREATRVRRQVFPLSTPAAEHDTLIHITG